MTGEVGTNPGRRGKRVRETSSTELPSPALAAAPAVAPTPETAESKQRSVPVNNGSAESRSLPRNSPDGKSAAGNQWATFTESAREKVNAARDQGNKAFEAFKKTNPVRVAADVATTAAVFAPLPAKVPLAMASYGLHQLSRHNQSKSESAKGIEVESHSFTKGGLIGEFKKAPIRTAADITAAAATFAPIQGKIVLAAASAGLNEISRRNRNREATDGAGSQPRTKLGNAADFATAAAIAAPLSAKPLLMATSYGLHQLDRRGQRDKNGTASHSAANGSGLLGEFKKAPVRTAADLTAAAAMIAPKGDKLVLAGTSAALYKLSRRNESLKANGVDESGSSGQKDSFYQRFSKAPLKTVAEFIDKRAENAPAILKYPLKTMSVSLHEISRRNQNADRGASSAPSERKTYFEMAKEFVGSSPSNLAQNQNYTAGRSSSIGNRQNANDRSSQEPSKKIASIGNNQSNITVNLDQTSVNKNTLKQENSTFASKIASYIGYSNTIPVTKGIVDDKKNDASKNISDTAHNNRREFADRPKSRDMGR